MTAQHQPSISVNCCCCCNTMQLTAKACMQIEQHLAPKRHTSWSLSAKHLASLSAQGRRLCFHARDCRVLARAAAAAVAFLPLDAVSLAARSWTALRAARAGGGDGAAAAAAGDCCRVAFVCAPASPALHTASSKSSGRARLHAIRRFKGLYSAAAAYCAMALSRLLWGASR